MSDDLYPYYDRELALLRSLAGEFAERHPANVVDGPAVEPGGRSVVAQPAAAADRTFDLGHKLFQLRA